MENDLENMLCVLHSLNESLPFGVIVTDGDPKDPKVIYVNDTFCSVTGYDNESFIGKNPKMLQGPKTNREVIDDLRHCLENREVFLGQTYNYTKDGEPFFLQWCISHFEFNEKSYYFAVQKYHGEASENPEILTHEETKTFSIRWNSTIRAQLSNILNYTEIVKQGDMEIALELIDDIRLRMEFITAIAKLNNYILGMR